MSVKPSVRTTRLLWKRWSGPVMFFIAAALMSMNTGATEGGGSSYPLGVSTINPGLEPSPEGFTLLSYNQFYSASHSRDSKGKDAIPGFHVSLAVTSPRLDYTFPDRWFPNGMRVGVQVVQPVFNSDLYTRFTKNGPSRHNETFGQGDTTIAPLVVGYKGKANSIGEFATKFKLSVIVPTGEYNVNNYVNRGRNYTSWEPQIGLQFFPRPDITFGANFTYSYNTANPATNYKSGQEFLMEFMAEYSPLPKLWVGLNGYVYRQLTADLKNGAEFQDGHFGSVVAVGPQVRYITSLGAITAKWQHEMLVRNRADGERLWIQLYVPL